MTAGPMHPSRAVHAQPPAAERARTIAARPTASLYGLGLGICQLWGATTTDAGEVLLVVPTDGPVTMALRGSPLGDVPARLTVTDRTPFPLSHPVRGLVRLSGWVGPIAEYEVTRLVLEFADAHACDRLFDVGLSATLLRLELAEVQLEETGGTTEVEPEDFLAARPDAVSRAENELVTEHCEALVQLASRVQRRVGRHDHVRLLGLDRFGVRFRVQGRSGCYDLRVPFAAALDGPAGVGAAVDRLLVCGPA
ncbi:DUF2470 domain-containing protein [Blastococcus sp. CT_GayMR19]|uniref:DUF2470 domain-containing protein n=1 Tax=Blastococcus sp. CT_GayMR19 TaxID=2559608 RepID=UPI001073F019|nr:DUF2470 domain-containing protein [Blastococcus sp. CT_GayMR19]TFV73006.1 DUF2470 domain-containing protein [Blastococcus sp. CT_GayMR19]